jgi:GNAT superfamily N-acetyltransferase
VIEPAATAPKPVQLRDGRTALIRRIEPGDRAAFLALHHALSDDSRHFRYFSARRSLPEHEIRHYTEVDQRDHAGLVVLVDGVIVGHGLYDRLDATSAEFASEVADTHQGHGIGTLLFEELGAIARGAGIERFVLHVLPANRRMLQVVRDLGFATKSGYDDGVVRVEIALAPTAESRRAHEARVNTARERRDERG